ncbi:hypothetical protein I602_1754 [Polaribacter dokdonensis DSW-5]|jgi:hypothetical protein|uniref:Uncharacterized protein n=1 Tax=Polaribacter dokdonensis DSW-5 TaxID=1300348 RepID=A0A0N1IY66_9FLAO|nr:hypothetical protein I602_1754 [Polaribacter dokdonensis DSW-5]
MLVVKILLIYLKINRIAFLFPKKESFFEVVIKTSFGYEVCNKTTFY